jgi:lipid A 3-O-deacylase
MNMGVRVGWSAALSLCALGCMMQANAADSTGALTFTLDNDLFTGSDNNYTNGLGVTWVSPDVSTYGDDRFVSKWSRFWSFLPFVGDEGYATYAAWTLAQEMHTPDDITNPNPPLDDQPYAGILYIDSLLYAHKDRWTHAWELKLGVVGPDSRAEHTQKDFHDMIGDDEPMGWDTQMPNEPVINITYTAAHLAAAGSAGGSAEWRVVPLGTVGLGTYFTGVGGGVYGEIGWNLVDALGGTGLRNGFNAASTVGVGPVTGWSVAFFGGLGGYGVAHYLPLDGTVFHDSRSVDSEPFIGTGSLGVSVRHGGFALGLAATFFTDTFSEQRESAAFGTLSMSWDL